MAMTLIYYVCSSPVYRYWFRVISHRRGRPWLAPRTQRTRRIHVLRNDTFFFCALHGMALLDTLAHSGSSLAPGMPLNSFVSWTGACHWFISFIHSSSCGMSPWSHYKPFLSTWCLAFLWHIKPCRSLSFHFDSSISFSSLHRYPPITIDSKSLHSLQDLYAFFP